ncbi:hypothetical protein AALO_G00121920 [Alosa alosa]|uniref:SWIM-type domain-containing protein n=1 Tax=Alosa alosa TaxID=278164 RepID=A0AAV6GRW9_9TELE|nr:uncharacterized protein LOC125300357 [Alosa alosa]KAG5275576.1 hypothetical protein AALO_G00121920 [Alosa alosa]
MAWTTSLDSLSAFTMMDVEKWADEGNRIPRSVLLKGYSNWIEGYITDIQVRRDEAGSVVRAKSFRSMRKNEPPYNLQIDFPSEGPFIGQSVCNCKAGQGHCNHQVGLLYTLAHLLKLQCKSVPPTISKTSLPQKWHVPPRTFGLTPKAINTMKISKLKPPTVCPPPKKYKRCDGILPNLYCPVPVPLPSDQFAKDLKSNLAAIGSNSQMYSLLLAAERHPVDKVATELGDVPLGSVLSYQALACPTSTTNVHHPPFPLPPQSCHYVTALTENESRFYSGMTVTLSDAETLEMETRGQSTNNTWHRV